MFSGKGDRRRTSVDCDDGVWDFSVAEGLVEGSISHPVANRRPAVVPMNNVHTIFPVGICVPYILNDVLLRCMQTHVVHITPFQSTRVDLHVPRQRTMGMGLTVASLR